MEPTAQTFGMRDDVREVVVLHVDEILADPHDNASRRSAPVTAEDVDVQRLSRAIKRDGGLLHPVFVRINHEGGDRPYRLVAGFRRYFAFVALGWKTIPTFLDDVDDATAWAINIAENANRAKASMYDAIEGVRRDLAAGMPVDQVADRWGLTAVDAKRYVLLCRLSPSLLEALRFDSQQATINVLLKIAALELPPDDAELLTEQQKAVALQQLHQAAWNEYQRSLEEPAAPAPKLKPKRKYRKRPGPSLYQRTKRAIELMPHAHEVQLDDGRWLQLDDRIRTAVAAVLSAVLDPNAARVR